MPSESATTATSMYRPDIEGLRAVAVLAVIANHAWENVLPGGYLGVDVFFVISGYVITGSLTARPHVRLSAFVAEFYSRRLRRLFPALVVCLAVTALVLAVIDEAPGRRLLVAAAAVFGVSNVALWSEGSNYFSDAIETNPFMHTWSLGVEEQFYVVYPLLLWLMLSGKVRKGHMMIALGVMAAATLAAYLRYHHTRPVETFYLMPFRFWELAAGALLHLAIAQRISKPRPVVAGVALAAMLSTMAVAASGEALPNVAVVVATAVLVWSSGGAVAWVLATPPAVAIGKLSYSLYLWHWPILTVTALAFGAGLMPMTGALVLTFVAAAASYRFVEKPVREMDWTPRKTLWRSGAAAVTVTAVLAVMAGPLEGALYTGHRVRLIAAGVETLMQDYAVPSTTARWSPRPCVLSNNADVGKTIDLEVCTLQTKAPSNQRVLVLGNSYSIALAPALDELVKARVRVTLTSSWGAAPIRTVAYSNSWSEASTYYWATVAPELFDQLSPGDWVLLVSDLNDMVPPREAPAAVHEAAAKQRSLLLQGLRELSGRLTGKGVKLAIIHDLPFVRDAKCTPMQAMPQWYRPLGPQCLLYSRDQTLDRRADLDRTLRQASSETGMVVIDLFDTFCPGAVCGFRGNEGTILYRDEWSHPSVEAARLVAPAVRSALLGEVGSSSKEP